MRTYREDTDRGGWRNAAVLMGILWLALVGMAGLNSADNKESPQTTETEDLTKVKGRVIAQGTVKQPAGPLALKSYQVEELKLAKAMDVKTKGQVKKAHTAYRVTMYGGPFPARARISILCLDGVAIPTALSEDLSAMIGVTFDKSIVRHGATMAVGYGDADSPCGPSLDAYSVFPEKLKLHAHR